MVRSLGLSERFERFAHRIRERKRKQRNEDDCSSAAQAKSGLPPIARKINGIRCADDGPNADTQ
jgi:hypothetical protein